MANEIKLKRGSGSDPGASDLVVGEVALRTDSGQLFTKKDNGTVVEIGAASGVSDGDKGDITVSNSGSTFTIDSGVVNNAKVASNAAIAGSKISPQFGSQDITATGNLSISSGDITINSLSPTINLTDSNNNPDYEVKNNNGTFVIRDGTAGADRFVVNTDGHVDIAGNVDFGAGIDVTGNITATGTITSIGLIMVDNKSILLGDSNDFRIRHTGSHSEITDEGTGNLRLGSNQTEIRSADLGEIQAKFIDDGAVELYHDNDKRLETTAGGVLVTGDFATSGSGTGSITSNEHINIPSDSGELRLGASYDLKIYHDGSHSYIVDGGTGELRLGSNSGIRLTKHDSETLAFFDPDGAAELYHNNSKKLETVSGGVYVYGQLIFGVGTSDDLFGGDNNKIILGSGNDLQIYHNGTNSFIENSTGSLYIRDTSSGDVRIQGKSGEDSIICNDDGSVELYHDNSKKIETSSSGVSVTGNLTATGSSATLKVSESGGATGEIRAGGATVYVGTESNHNVSFISNDTVRMILTNGGNLNPNVDSTYNLGSNSTRWANVYADTLYGDGSNLTGIASFASGTRMLFQQTSAPTGWTKDTSDTNNRALRVVSGSAGSGGSVAFTTAFASQSVSGSVANTTAGGTTGNTTAGGTTGNTTAGGTVGNHTLSTSQIPSHRHEMRQLAAGLGCGPNISQAGIVGTAACATNNTAAYTFNTGGGGSHNHSFSGSAHNHTFSGSAHNHTFTGSAHNHSFSGTSINLAVQYLDVIIASKN